MRSNTFHWGMFGALALGMVFGQGKALADLPPGAQVAYEVGAAEVAELRAIAAALQAEEGLAVRALEGALTDVAQREALIEAGVLSKIATLRKHMSKPDIAKLAAAVADPANKFRTEQFFSVANAVAKADKQIDYPTLHGMLVARRQAEMAALSRVGTREGAAQAPAPEVMPWEDPAQAAALEKAYFEAKFNHTILAARQADAEALYKRMAAANWTDPKQREADEAAFPGVKREARLIGALARAKRNYCTDGSFQPVAGQQSCDFESQKAFEGMLVNVYLGLLRGGMQFVRFNPTKKAFEIVKYSPRDAEAFFRFMYNYLVHDLGLPASAKAKSSLTGGLIFTADVVNSDQYVQEAFTRMMDEMTKKVAEEGRRLVTSGQYTPQQVEQMILRMWEQAGFNHIAANQELLACGTGDKENGGIPNYDFMSQAQPITEIPLVMTY